MHQYTGKLAVLVVNQLIRLWTYFSLLLNWKAEVKKTRQMTMESEALEKQFSTIDQHVECLLGNPAYGQRVTDFKRKDRNYNFDQIFYGTIPTITSSYSYLNKSGESDYSSDFPFSSSSEVGYPPRVPRSDD